jgi:UDP-sulfoquinovose synthase
MKVLVLGGDGFCGWPTALHLSAHGHEVAIVDNLSRRDIDDELGVQSLTPIAAIEVRLAAWKAQSGRDIAFHRLTLGQDFDAVVALLGAWKPDSLVHFAEQRAAPYSMKSARHKRYTVNNNLNATHDVLAAVVESGHDIHVVHLGTMGVYGYGTAGMAIPEGYLKIKLDTPDGQVEQEILYPANPGSIYHMTKTQDALFFQFYARNDKVRITDLHQGIVWGCQTEETREHPDLVNRFDFDGDYGTVLNRFLIQSQLGFPLTVHGGGGQTRAFINIQDTVRCVRLALETPPARGERVRIMNQMTECWRVRELADIVSGLTGAQIAFLANPRQEAEENDLFVENCKLRNLGLQPITLAEGLLTEITEIAKAYASRADLSRVLCLSAWNAERAAAIAEPLITAQRIPAE